MSEEPRTQHNIESDESGLLLSVEPNSERSLEFSALIDDTDNVDAEEETPDTDTEDTVGDTDNTDATDTDTTDDADGTD